MCRLPCNFAFLTQSGHVHWKVPPRSGIVRTTPSPLMCSYYTLADYPYEMVRRANSSACFK